MTKPPNIIKPPRQRAVKKAVADVFDGIHQENGVYHNPFKYNCPHFILKVYVMPFISMFSQIYSTGTTCHSPTKRVTVDLRRNPRRSEHGVLSNITNRICSTTCLKDNTRRRSRNVAPETATCLFGDDSDESEDRGNAECDDDIGMFCNEEIKYYICNISVPCNSFTFV